MNLNVCLSSWLVVSMKLTLFVEKKLQNLQSFADLCSTRRCFIT